jgi:photosystem II stability/assembly factor-like uncharacterized protein
VSSDFAASVADEVLCGLGMAGPPATATDVWRTLAREGSDLTRAQVRGGLNGQARRTPPLVRVAGHGPGRGGNPANLYEFTDAGRTWLADGDPDEAPARIWCGLGWPP